MPQHGVGGCVAAAEGGEGRREGGEALTGREGMAMEGPIRRPAVAGMFYSGTREGLLRQLEACYLHELGPGALPKVNPSGPRRVIGLVSPHAGYMYSGPTAARGYYLLAQDGFPTTAIIIGPSHHMPALAPAAIQTAGGWATPLGVSPIDSELAEAIAAGWPEFAVGERYFTGEHSLEVQLPFLQHLYGTELRIVPILMIDQHADVARAVGRAMAEAAASRDCVIVASTDLSHYVPPDRARRLDQALIDRILALDPDGLVELALQPHNSMCGYGAVAAMLHAAIALGAKAAHVLGYSHSGMIEPMGQVVGYVSIAVQRR